MATQAAIFAETIAGMKKAIKRQDYDSDSDSSIVALTNRGNKLKRKARYVHQGQLAPPTGPPVYRRKITHAGFERNIISRNPPLVDEEGYEVDSEDDDERAQDAAASAADQDPYAGVRIEYLLAPLTSASELPNHPTLSKPFTTRTLTNLTKQAGEMVQKERASLWKIKHLLTKLSGDNTWIPCENVETETDSTLFIDVRDKHRNVQLEKLALKDEGDHISVGTMASEAGTDSSAKGVPETLTADVASNPGNGVTVNEATIGKHSAKVGAVNSNENTLEQKNHTNGATDTGESSPKNILEETVEKITMDGPGSIGPDGPEGPEEQADVPMPRRMRTRAQAQAATDTATSRTRSVTPDSSFEMSVHPYFLAPKKSHPERDMGLPPLEAEETRRLLQLYIQKQEEVCRGAQRVYEGLLRADRCRHLVMKWAKAEAHVGANRDMSDGEDWYDLEEWDLNEDLKKGENEEDEDPQTVAKKTRTRRQ